MTSVIIVESPGKIKKIQGFLGNSYRVMASVGHVRDLPSKDIGVSAPDFKPNYEPTDRGKEVLAKLKKECKNADCVYLATDPDREGEAIAWHLQDALNLKDPKRITYTEITETAVKNAINSPRQIDLNLVKAQEGRRVLDRLYGYMVSPELSNFVGSWLSAGRVQTPALKLVVEREKEIKQFSATTHYGIEANFEALDHVKTGWKANWQPKQGWLDGDNPYFLDKDKAAQIANIKSFTVADYEEKEAKTSPPPPFNTSTLQQVASAALKFAPKKTMEVAQKLYEGGHITYMRTDSFNLSEEALIEIKLIAQENDWPLVSEPRTWKSKDGAQEAHEAIRPTHFEVEGAGANDDEKALYSLIRMRSIACQLQEAVFATNKVTLSADCDGKPVVFEALGRRLSFPGWKVLNMKLGETEAEDEAENPVPKLDKGSTVIANETKLLTKSTKPPARYTEAALVKELENRGIGRPSTFAAILDNIVTRKYVAIEKRQLKPTELGEKIIGALDQRFGFLDYDFTRQLESDLDKISEGSKTYHDVVSGAYEILKDELAAFVKDTGYPCPDCGKPLRHMVNKGIYDFWGCSGFKYGCKVNFKNEAGKPGIRNEKIISE